MPSLSNGTIYSIFAYMRFVQQKFRNIFALITVSALRTSVPQGVYSLMMLGTAVFAFKLPPYVDEKKPRLFVTNCIVFFLEYIEGECIWGKEGHSIGGGGGREVMRRVKLKER